MFKRLWNNTVSIGKVMWNTSAKIVNKTTANANRANNQANPDEPEFFTTLKITINNIQLHLEAELATKLDTDVYVQSLQRNNTAIPYPLDADRLVDDTALYDYKSTINLLIQAQALLDNIILVAPSIIDLAKKPTRIEMIGELAGQLTIDNNNIVDGIAGIIQSFDELNNIIKALHLASTLKAFSSMPELRAKIQSLIPSSAMAVKNLLSPNTSITPANPQEFENLIPLAPIQIPDIDDIMAKHLDHLPKDGIERVKITEAINRIKNVIHKIDAFALTSKSLYQTLKIVYKIYPDITWIFASSPQLFSSFGVAFQEGLLNVAQYINQVFKKITLKLDQYEIEYYLKQDFLKKLSIANLSSLDDMITQFNSLIEKRGFEFKLEDRYPYTLAITRQREESKNLIANESITYQLLDRRIIADQVRHTQHLQTQQQEQTNAEISALNTTRHRALELIDARIKAIKGNLQRFWAILHETDPIKLTLLECLRQQIPVATSLHHALDMVAQIGNNKHEMYRLWQGETGKTLRSIRATAYVKQDYIDQISNEIARLKNLRAETFYLFSGYRRTKLENRVRALEVLRKTISKSGFNLNDALIEIHANNKTNYELLHTDEKNLLASLKNIDANISHLNLGKKIIGNSIIETPRSAATASEHQQVIAKKIQQLEADLNERWFIKRWFFSAAITKKITLLKRLSNELNTTTLESGLRRIATNPHTNTDYYLLHEGRTGAILKKLEFDLNPRANTLEGLHHAITRLYSLREKHYGLFAYQEKHIEERIATLKRLTSSFTKSNDTTINFAYHMLQTNDKSMIAADVQGILCQR